MGKAASGSLAERGERAYLVLDERLCLGGRNIHISSAESDEIGKARMRADRDAVIAREGDGLLHHERIGRMETAGYVGGRNIFYDLIVEPQLIVAEALAEIAVKIYFVHIYAPLSIFKLDIFDIGYEHMPRRMSYRDGRFRAHQSRLRSDAARPEYRYFAGIYSNRIAEIGL